MWSYNGKVFNIYLGGKNMNKVVLMGRLTRDPEVRYSQGQNQTAIARFTLAVDRRFKRICRKLSKTGN